MKNNLEISKFFAEEAFKYASPLLTIDTQLKSEFEEWWKCFINNLEYKDLTGRWYNFTEEIMKGTSFVPDIRIKE